ncbi:M23 family metallopeptidase [Sedimenticola thiotaurini]|uniref:M23 family metallopeptidase n=1 Tax=Sedimenticola thiotaurini TaxID=1543721 RepID=UPI000699A855|nr:M23 family metallopeptidase [Sedimenticola thiotaurini]
MKMMLLSRFFHKTGRLPIASAGSLGILVPAFLLLLGGTLWGGYQWGVSASSQAAGDTTTDVVRDLLLAQRDELQETKGRTQDHLDALALRLGQLQSHILRINALGERLAQAAKLDEDEFDFDEEPARGGIEEGELAQSVSLSELVADMEQLSQVITDREHKLDLMEGLIFDKQMNEAMLPAGRPVEKGWISSRYGYRKDPFTGKKTFHRGVDLAGKKNSNVVAVASGIVTWIGERGGYGKLVEIRHTDGYVTRYGHNSKILVEPGELVTQGQPIALMGSSGRSTGPHVHFEIVKNGKTVNPSKYLRIKR